MAETSATTRPRARIDMEHARQLMGQGLRPGGAAILLGCSFSGARQAFTRLGYRPRPARRLTAAELGEMARLRAAGLGYRATARRLGVTAAAVGWRVRSGALSGGGMAEARQDG